MVLQYYDAVVVGAGLGGIYQLRSLLELGLKVKVLEKAEAPGGTWYWNRYPGAMSDTPSYLYRYSWDKEDLKTYTWSDTYLDAKDVLAYLEHVIDRHDLRKHMQFGTHVQSARWNQEDSTWTLETSKGNFTTRYFVTAIGLLSEPNWPSISGRDNFEGEMYHTARWPETYDFKGKRVGVIGNGSTGVQIITAIAKEVGSLHCFQRHPQYSVPAGRRPVTKEERVAINATWDEIWYRERKTLGGMGIDASTTDAMSVSEEERERVYQEAWTQGGGTRFLLGTFKDIVTDVAANQTACDFIKKKIAEIVKDPEKRRKLTPNELYVRRPLCDVGYFEQFNRDNVDIVSLSDNPIAEFTTKGIKLADGTVHELDVIVCATGFNAFDGAYRRIKITGRNGINLNEHWVNGPRSNMGVAITNFPNLFMVVGPQSTLSNVPPMLEAQIEFITGAVKHVEGQRNENSQNLTIETTQKSEDQWGEMCNFFSSKMLFKTSPSYFFGANVEGKTRSVLVFFGGLAMLVQKLQECADGGYSGFDVGVPT